MNRLRLLACLIYFIPFFIRSLPELPLYLTLDCPACALALEKLQNEPFPERLILVDAPLEINCLIGKVYELAPEKQVAFIDFYRKDRLHLQLRTFCESAQIDLNQLQKCKKCHFYQLSVKENLYYVMSYFISTVPFGGARNRGQDVRAQKTLIDHSSSL